MNQNLIYGKHAIEQVLKNNPMRIKALYALDHLVDSAEHIVSLAKTHGICLQVIQKKTLEKWLPGKNHQGWVAECSQLKKQVESDLNAYFETLQKKAQSIQPFWLILEQIQDPHNLGACLRSAEAAGVCGVVLPEKQTAPLSGVVHKVSSGAVESLNIYQVKNLNRVLEKFKAAGIWLVGLDSEAGENFYTLDLSAPVALVLGSEGKGLRKSTKDKCDYLAHLPMQGKVESLNVSVATGICLYETLRSRQSQRL